MKKRNRLFLVILFVLVMSAGTLACSRGPKILEWPKKNEDIEEGKIEVTKYPGEYETRASILYKIADIDTSYSSYFKGGIVAYIEELDEHYILFAPETPYHWSMVGKKTGNYLIIGTPGEGLVVINLKTLDMKRYRLEEPDDSIRILEIEGNKVIVNGNIEIELLEDEDRQAEEWNGSQK